MNNNIIDQYSEEELRELVANSYSMRELQRKWVIVLLEQILKL